MDSRSTLPKSHKQVSDNIKGSVQRNLFEGLQVSKSNDVNCNTCDMSYRENAKHVLVQCKAPSHIRENFITELKDVFEEFTKLTLTQSWCLFSVI